MTLKELAAHCLAESNHSEELCASKLSGHNRVPPVAGASDSVVIPFLVLFSFLIILPVCVAVPSEVRAQSQWIPNKAIEIIISDKDPQAEKIASYLASMDLRAKITNGNGLSAARSDIKRRLIVVKTVNDDFGEAAFALLDRGNPYRILVTSSNLLALHFVNKTEHEPLAILAQSQPLALYARKGSPYMIAKDILQDALAANPETLAIGIAELSPPQLVELEWILDKAVLGGI